MNNVFDFSLENFGVIALSTFGIYISVVLFTRIFGKRSLSKMSSFDFAMTVAVGSLIATTALSSDVSLLEGIVAVFFIYLYQLLLAYLRRWRNVKKVIDNSPLLLMSKDVILKENLKKAQLSEADLRSTLREANVINLTDVKAVIFETTGNIVVIHSDDRNKELDEWLMKDVALEYDRKLL